MSVARKKHRQEMGRPNDDRSVSEPAADGSFRALYDRGLEEVYGYLLHRCGDVHVAEDLTSETFLAAVAAVKAERGESLTVPWLIGVARHKLVDHWRRKA